MTHEHEHDHDHDHEHEHDHERRAGARLRRRRSRTSAPTRTTPSAFTPAQPAPARGPARLPGSPLLPGRRVAPVRGACRSSRTPATEPTVVPDPDLGRAAQARPSRRASFAFELGRRAAPADGYVLDGGDDCADIRCSCRSSTRRAVTRRTAPAATSTSSPRTTARTPSTSTSPTTRRASTRRPTRARSRRPRTGCRSGSRPANGCPRTLLQPDRAVHPGGDARAMRDDQRRPARDERRE